MKRTVIAIIISLLTVGITSAQRTTRPRLRTIAEQPKATADTVAAEPGEITVSGYEKALRSRKETMFVTNYTDRDVSEIALTVDYQDMHGRQLHQRTEAVKCSIPPGETRQISIPSWDRHNVWYYHLTQPPRSKAQATPYKVSVSVIYLVSPRP